MIITNNLLSAQVALNIGLIKDGKSKSMEKLSSGYKLNRASDDAAGLAISEKMRSQVRGLMRAAQNTTDGISFVQTTDGATDQAANILQRMREITIQALNTAVNTEEDRAKIQTEFDQLQSELDRINDQTEFNKKACFHHYATDHYVTEGNINWVQDQVHVIDNLNNSMTIRYKTEPDSAESEVTVRVPNGTYTTQQLADEIDDVMGRLGLDPETLALELTDRGTCNLVLDNGAEITDMSGGLTYLFHDEYAGSEVGSLIGTTLFEPGTSGLRIYEGHNDEMEFKIKYLDGSSTKDVKIKIPTTPDDCYTRQEMIDYLNQKLAGTGVSAIEYGEKSIMLGSDKAIVTGLRGNMFEIDDPNEPGSIIATSVFYDNTKYGRTTLEEAQFLGGDIINKDDPLNKKITINDDNNLLRVRVNDKTGDFTDVRLQTGSYTFDQMVTQLKNAFRNANVPLTASAKDTSTGVSLQNGSYATLTGFKITTTDKGIGTSIEFDPSMEAYKTLFTDRVYTNVGKDITKEVSQRYSVYKNSLKGARVFSGSTNLPLTINSSNHSLTLRLYETPYGGNSSQKSYSVTVPDGTYQSAGDIADALNQGLASAGLSEKVSALATTGGTIMLSPASGNKTVGYRDVNVQTIAVSGTAYNTLFVGSQSSPDETEAVSVPASSHPELTITENLLPENPVGNLTYHFQVNGENRYVTLSDPVYTREDFLQKLNEGLAGQPDTITSRASSATSTAGTTTNKNVSRSDTVTEEPETTTIYANARGTGSQQQGTTEQSQMTPAKYTVPVALPSTKTLDNSNNDIRITVNGNVYHVSLTEKTYQSPQELAEEIQTQLDNTISRGSDKINVSLDSSNRLVFESVLTGNTISFSFGNEKGVGQADSSSFFHGLTSTPRAASVSTGKALQTPINIPAGTTMSIYVNGVNRSVTWSEAANYTDKNAFLTALNDKLRDIGVVASNPSNLTFTTIEKGRQKSISLNTASSPAFFESLFGTLVTKTPATMTLGTALKTADVPMKAGENTFSIKVGSTTYTSTFDVGRNYSRQEIVDKLNSDFADVATVSMASNGILTFTTKQTGSGTRISLPSSSVTCAGLFGENVKHHPGVEASMTDDGYLKLTGQGDGTYNYAISMFRKDGSDILPARQQTKPVNPTISAASTQNVGVYKASSSHKLSEPIAITSDNNTLSLTLYRNGSTLSRTVTVPQGTYSVQGLEQALQGALDGAIGTGELTVSHNSLPGLTFTSAPKYNINDVSWGGTFYSRIIKGDMQVTGKAEVSSKDGGQTVSDTYIVGRKDVRNQTTVISPNTNDSFSLELWKDNRKYTLAFTLDPGSYRSDELTDMLNQKLSAAATAQGLPAGIVKADVGRYNTGVVGSDDANALDFYLNKEIPLEAGRYRIEGLEGDSLFDIFYKTVGNLTAAYTSGTKDLSAGVDIEEGKQDFTITVDGTTYRYTIDPTGHYTDEELVDKLNELIRSTSPNAPITASLSRGAIKFSHDSIGKHTVTSVRGPAIQSFYYENDAAYGEDDELWLQVGANAGQGIKFSRYSVSSHALHVNTVNVTERRYADKALTRIDEAMNLLMSNRSKFGALQNRLEHTRNVDTNTAINLQDAESRIRDTDIAEEMMHLSKKNILEQAGLSVLTQAIRQPQTVLSLLHP